MGVLELPKGGMKAGSHGNIEESTPGEGNGNPLQYSCLENSIDRGAWWATVHGVAKSRTRLSNFTHSLRNDSSRELFITILISLMRLWAGSVTYLCHTSSYVGLGTKKELMVELSKSGVVEVSLLLHTSELLTSHISLRSG